MKETKLPLGRETGYPQNYAPETLFPIPRAESRETLGIASSPLPFAGVDIWNAWELTWLGRGGLPRVATAEIRVPADSPNLVESKSLKLYLGSLAMTEFPNDEAVVTTLAKDLSAAAGTGVEVELNPDLAVGELEGECIDALEVTCDSGDTDSGLLQADDENIAHESLHSHLLRSLCPVTGQPDIGSLVVNYVGPRLERASLLRYVVSFRRHQDFHEACVERIFVDILRRCRPQALSVYARYTRRGGIDINPYRSTGNERPANTRLWRQ